MRTFESIINSQLCQRLHHFVFSPPNLYKNFSKGKGCHSSLRLGNNKNLLKMRCLRYGSYQRQPNSVSNPPYRYRKLSKAESNSLLDHQQCPLHSAKKKVSIRALKIHHSGALTGVPFSTVTRLHCYSKATFFLLFLKVSEKTETVFIIFVYDVYNTGKAKLPMNKFWYCFLLSKHILLMFLLKANLAQF